MYDLRVPVVSGYVMCVLFDDVVLCLMYSVWFMTYGYALPLSMSLIVYYVCVRVLRSMVYDVSCIA